MGYKKIDDQLIEDLKQGKVYLSIHPDYFEEYKEWLDNIGIKKYWTNLQYRVCIKKYTYMHIHVDNPAMQRLTKSDVKFIRKENKRFKMEKLLEEKK